MSLEKSELILKNDVCSDEKTETVLGGKVGLDCTVEKDKDSKGGINVKLKEKKRKREESDFKLLEKCNEKEKLSMESEEVERNIMEKSNSILSENKARVASTATVANFSVPARVFARGEMLVKVKPMVKKKS